MNESTDGTWEIPGGETARKVSAAFAAVADEQLEAAYDLGVQDSMLRATQIERVLTDLIAELKERAYSNLEGGYGPYRQMADRAEARLSALTGAEAQEVTDSNVYGSIALGEVYGDE